MTPLLESLESRTLLSAAPAQMTGLFSDQGALKALVKADKADVAKCTRVATAEVRTLVADMRKMRNAQDVALATMVRRDTLSGVAMLSTDLKKLFSSGSSAGQRVAADAQRLARDPLNAALIGRVLADATAIFNLSTNNAFDSDAASLQSAISADINQVASVNPSDAKLQADVSAAQAALQACATTLQGDGNALTGSFSTFFNDIRSLVPGG